jgi:hypothetical protein
MKIFKTSDDRTGKWKLILSAKFSLLWCEVLGLHAGFFKNSGLLIASGLPIIKEI